MIMINVQYNPFISYMIMINVQYSPIESATISTSRVAYKIR